MELPFGGDTWSSPSEIGVDGDAHEISFTLQCTVDGWQVEATSTTGLTNEVAYASEVECEPLRLVFEFTGPFGQAPTAGDPYQTCPDGLTLTIEEQSVECDCCCCFEDFGCSIKMSITSSFVPEPGDCLYTEDAYTPGTFEHPSGFEFNLTDLSGQVCWTYGVDLGTYVSFWIDAVTRSTPALACLDDALCGDGYPDEQYTYVLAAYIKSRPAEDSGHCRIIMDIVLQRDCNAVAGEPNVRAGWALVGSYKSDISPTGCYSTGTDPVEVELTLDGASASGLFSLPGTATLLVECA